VVKTDLRTVVNNVVNVVNGVGQCDTYRVSDSVTHTGCRTGCVPTGVGQGVYLLVSDRCVNSVSDRCVKQGVGQSVEQVSDRVLNRCRTGC